ncbi:MAG: homoserine dehydrogenase [Erysipelotrichaceae bacterium]|nr:homoserine dehydrogenase [Erysipelotrichaceae bacterium]
MKIGLLGYGVVGSGVGKIIDDGLTWEVRELEVARILVKDESELKDPRMTLSADEILNDPEIDVIVECMGGLEPAHTYVRKALENGKYVVTSNKKMLASYCSELFDIARKNNVTVHYEAACGGGIPWMASLDRTRRVDDIISFRGIFNGTTNYILERMSKEHSSFADKLKEAQELGYAERDPSDDIDGYDVRSKVSLSCVKAFDTVQNTEDITTFGIRTISEADLQYCEDHGLACKLLGNGEFHHSCISAYVIPVFLGKEDVFANIPLNFNAIESNSLTLGRAMFYGQGAGSLPTAHAVVQNIVDIWKNQDPEINDKFPVSIDNSRHEGCYYIRTGKPEFFLDAAAEWISDNTLLTKKMSLRKVAGMVEQADDETLFIAEVTA